MDGIGKVRNSVLIRVAVWQVGRGLERLGKVGQGRDRYGRRGMARIGGCGTER